GGRRNCVNGVRPDEFLDIEHVAVFGILCAGACPEQTLGLATVCGERLPAGSAEKLLILFVGAAGVSDSNFAMERLEEGLFARVGFGLEHSVDFAVDERINAADEEAGNAGDVRNVLALGYTSFQSREISFCDLFVSRLRKQKRDVDVDALFQGLANRGNSLGSRGDLDHDIGAANGLPETASF